MKHNEDVVNHLARMIALKVKMKLREEGDALRNILPRASGIAHMLEEWDFGPERVKLTSESVKEVCGLLRKVDQDEYAESIERLWERVLKERDSMAAVWLLAQIIHACASLV